jgi:hypothetical protein
MVFSSCLLNIRGLSFNKRLGLFKDHQIRTELMRRGKTGTYEITTVGGEQVKAFIPQP